MAPFLTPTYFVWGTGLVARAGGFEIITARIHERLGVPEVAPRFLWENVMNLFVLDKSPMKAAEYHCDKHVP